MSTATASPETAARAAAEWWAEQVGAPVHHPVRPNQRDAHSIFAEEALATLAARHPVPRGAAPVFAADLEKRIEEMLGRVGHISLGVDYGPDLELAEAAEAAGIHCGRFPIKTHMWLTADYVTAALGYGAQAKLIWQHPDWERPPCHTQNYVETGDDYEPRDEICSRLKFHDGDHGDWIPDPYRCAECDGTYTDHYGKPRKPWTHSWKPTIPGDES